MSTLQNYMRQNVDFSIADARIHNPQMQATDIFRRISVAHSLAGGLQLQADDNARRVATSYCALTGMECANAGGLYAPFGGAGLNVPMPMFAARVAGPSQSQTQSQTQTGANAQVTPANPWTAQAYDAYWRGGARTNIDSVSESRCVIPASYGVFGGSGMLGGGCGTQSASVAMPAVTKDTMDMDCYMACQSNAGASQACATLCALQPASSWKEDAGPFSVAAPSSGPRFDADLPLSVGLDDCLRQCTDAPLPGQQQACRLGCVAQTGAPSLFNNASGSCTLSCVQSCAAGGGSAIDCGRQCVNACTGTTRQNPYATPTAAIPIGF